MMKRTKKVSGIPPMSDKDLGDFWDGNEPEDFEGWQQGTLNFKRPPKKLVQLRLEPRDISLWDIL